MVQQNDGKKKKNSDSANENAGDETLVIENPPTDGEDQELVRAEIDAEMKAEIEAIEEEEVLEALAAAEDATDEAQAAAEEAISEAQAAKADSESDSQGYSTSREADTNEPDEAAPEKEQVKIEFPFSELIRERVPKAFEVAEKVATDWKNEGNFADLGITHPVAGIVAAQALTKAKEVEKKLEEKGVISMAKMGFAIAKSQVEHLKNKIVK